MHTRNNENIIMIIYSEKCNDIQKQSFFSKLLRQVLSIKLFFWHCTKRREGLPYKCLQKNEIKNKLKPKLIAL